MRFSALHPGFFNYKPCEAIALNVEITNKTYPNQFGLFDLSNLNNLSNLSNLTDLIPLKIEIFENYFQTLGEISPFSSLGIDKWLREFGLLVISVINLEASLAFRGTCRYHKVSEEKKND